MICAHLPNLFSRRFKQVVEKIFFLETHSAFIPLTDSSTISRAMHTEKIWREPPAFLSKYFFYSLLDWERLSQNERDQLEKNKTILKLKKNEIVYEEGI